MKSYPSIPRGIPMEFEAHVFDKIDGSNLRFEWSRKRGWYKFGTRKRLFDETDKVFGPAIPEFMETLADPVAEVARKQRWDRLIIFCEGAGEHSFAGYHRPDEPMRVYLIDAAPYKQGILPPKKYLDLFGHIQARAAYLGRRKWNAGFIQAVRNGEVEDVTFEGVVGKALVKKKIVMAKAKTQAWIDRVLEKFGDDGKAIVES